MRKIKEITIELTDKCLNNCLHCSSKADANNNTFLTLDKIKEVVEGYEPQQVNVSGGEPLLHRDIKEILIYLKSKNIKVKLYTCGVIDGFKKILLEIHSLIDVIVFPFYSYNENIYNTITNNDLAYIYVTHAIKVAKKLNMNIEAHIVPMTINIDTLWETVGYLLEYANISKVNILKLVVQGRATKDIELNDNLLIEKLKLIESTYEDNIKLGLPLNEKTCVAGTEKLVLMCNNKLIPCESYKDGICKCKRLLI